MIFGKIRNRLCNEDGNVGVLVALVMFVVMGMLCMTWNTVQLSKEKIRLQNAADAAALEHAVWQARGMNALQNINDEAYTALQTASVLLKVAQVMEVGAKAAYAIPVVGTVLAQVLHFGALVVGGASAIMANIVVNVVLKYTAVFYARGSCALGYISAQQMAAMNGAAPVLPFAVKVLGFDLGLYAVGISVRPLDTFRLPVEAKSVDKAPLKKNNAAAKAVFTASAWSAMFKFFGVGNDWEWKPWVSMNADKNLGDRPAPSLWMAMKWKNNIHVLPLKGWSPNYGESALDDSPMFALAAAQCVTGDLIVHNEKTDSKKTNQRPAGFGTGATAKLVPIAEALGSIPNKTAGKIVGTGVGLVVWH